jgi:hypothetical protein
MTVLLEPPLNASISREINAAFEKRNPSADQRTKIIVFNGRRPEKTKHGRRVSACDFHKLAGPLRLSHAPSRSAALDDAASSAFGPKGEVVG